MSPATLYALDVSEAARAAGVEAPVAVSAGVLAQFKDGTRADLDRMLGAFCRLALAAPQYERTTVAPGVVLLDMNGRRFLVTEHARSSDGADSFGIMTLIEVQLAGTLEIALDVRERADRELQ